MRRHIAFTLLLISLTALWEMVESTMGVHKNGIINLLRILDEIKVRGKLAQERRRSV